MYSKIQDYLSEKNVQKIAWLLLATGIIYRIILWWQNRGLFIDEANLARNIYERNFFGLAKPLTYEQFAPPVFLWITKLNTIFFGFDERVLRLFPLFSGIASLFLFYKIAKEFISFKSLWYPLALFATGALYLRYSTEFKQYMPDALVSLLLLYTAIKLHVLKSSGIRFSLIWIVLGSVAIWTSMPSVFILTAVGLYYFIQLILSDQKKKIAILVIIGVSWLLQFGFYFFIILKDQMNSSYLQNFHQWYFLDAFPKNFEQFKSHNWLVIKGLTEAVGGKTEYLKGSLKVSLTLNLFLTFLGYIHIFKTKNFKGILLIVPGVLVLAASMMKSYSLTERLMLFCIPCWLILIGMGLEFALQMRFKFFKIILVAVAIFVVIKFNKISYLTTRPLRLESMNKCLDYLVENKITANDLYVHNLASGGYVFYTEIHPKKDKWKSLKNAHQLTWQTNLMQLFETTKVRSALLSSSMGDGVYPIWEDIKSTNNIESVSDETDAKAVIFSPK
jgi:hypothetical protein